MKLRDLIEELNVLKSKLEVWTQVSIFLQEFISTDSREAKKSLVVEGSDNYFVPDEVIEEILAHIQTDYIEQTEGEIKQLEERAL